MAKDEKITSEEKLLAAMVYGEASTKEDVNEQKALASVLVRQMKSRGYSTMDAFVKGEKTFSFVVNDGNARYKSFKDADDKKIHEDTAMNNALLAAKNAISDGDDLSNGAYFWDGQDIKSNYKNHFKVKYGIKFTKSEHNIYDIKESIKLVVIMKTTVSIKTVNGKRKKEKKKTEVGRYDHVYESTAAYGGTIFWKNNPDYIELSKGKEYK